MEKPDGSRWSHPVFVSVRHTQHQELPGNRKKTRTGSGSMDRGGEDGQCTNGGRRGIRTRGKATQFETESARSFSANGCEKGRPKEAPLVFRKIPEISH
uniref:Uncharacterized protein n=1 Tax=Siphoviridae sp. ctBLh2 TaxID=2827803 RepID=A0A8S5S466_9CAUD|nr:MAG TPA: hypothetical protein [Siphoviridae sp. ctBLh2]